ncbi:DNA polymerase III subunit chi [Brucella thiophenivorans]|uniref:DNA polymerase III chi subunit, HolC family protein n=1 Tax=Brucella thiophenivorans TaxID=571255 RepID=A0A256FV45_9HYPH|nr:DNA polymerase III subunit chi [Brucella thiophenivorans]OYR18737.1 DNA polymerase III chi subunit, HolC family protein [Brucella thiophenivorans]
MAEILFYHLTESTLDEALPGLVERSLTRGWRVTIQALTEERRDTLDSLLWTFSDASFVAHGTDQEPNPELQPVLLTTSQVNLNGATVRFLVEGAALEDASSYDRLVVMFDGHNQDQLEHARTQWKAFKTENHDLTYWQQTPDRRWERKA